MATASFGESIIALWDWRRRIAELYAQVRALEPRAASQHWRAVRDDLFRSHPQSPMDPSRRSSFSGLSYFEYDPSLRILISLVSKEATEATKMDLGPDGPLSLTPFARTNGLSQKFGGELTMYWIGGYGGGVFLPFKDGTTRAE